MLSPGARIGPYEILEPIGAGGMGTVYRARDPRLERDVALKVVSAALGGDVSALGRFEREAKILAGLNHPHVATIHAIEEDRGTRFIVLELIPGESLADRIARGPVPIREALEWARQVASALEAAHSAGIVHRDLKPANVRLRPDGAVKVLDFGIAKALIPTRTTPDAPTVTSVDGTAASLTAEGAVIGTPGYMSPEQLRGAPIDERADLWALGCLLYEMLTGRRAFAGATLADTLARILTAEPDWAELPADLPAAVAVSLRRCLEKDLSRRNVTAFELRGVLEAAVAEERPAVATLRFVQATFSDGIDASPAWMPDGSSLIYSGGDQPVRKLFRKRFDGPLAEPLTLGDHDDIQPAVSPDGRTIAFVRARHAGRRLDPSDAFGWHDGGDVWAIDVDSRTERKLADQAFNPHYAPDGRRIAVDASWGGPRRIWLIDAHGRNPAQLTTDTSEAVVHIRPRWSPDGKRIVFQCVERTQFGLKWIDLESRRVVALGSDRYPDYQPVWSASGREVVFSSYRSGGLNLWRLPVGPAGEPAGEPEQITTGAGQDLEASPTPDGKRLAFTTLRQNADLWRLPVSPETGRPTGAPTKVIATSREESRGAWSPDGTRIAFNSDRGGAMNIWILDIASGAVRPVTSGPGGDYQANWSPDGKTLAFFSSRGGHPAIWTVDVDGGEPVRLGEPGAIEINPFHSPDGRHIAYQSDRDGRLEVWVMGSDGSRPRQLTRIGASGHFLRWTSDGRWIIFRSPSGGRPGTFRVPIDGGEAERLVEVVGGAHMSFSPDGSRILDVLAHKTLWVSPLTGGAPEPVFEFDDPDVRIDYPVWSPDGRWVVFDRFRPQGGDIWVVEGSA